jgi:hypothetical protein
MALMQTTAQCCRSHPADGHASTSSRTPRALAQCLPNAFLIALALDAIALARPCRAHSRSRCRGRNLRILEREPHASLARRRRVTMSVPSDVIPHAQSSARIVAPARLGVVHRFEHEYAGSLASTVPLRFWQMGKCRAATEARRLPLPHGAVVWGASEAPTMATSTSPLRMKSRPCLMACAPERRRCRSPNVGPLTPHSMPICAAADEPMNARASVGGWKAA